MLLATAASWWKMLVRKCACGNTVEHERIELLNSYVCSKCANAGVAQPPPVRGAMIYGHKTAGEIEIMPESTFTLHKQAFRRVGQQSNLRRVSPSYA